MSIYRFVGHTATKEGVFELKDFGQSIELDDKVARAEILDGVALLPAADFDALGFTPLELKDFRSPDSHHDNVDPVFLDKKRRAWKAAFDVREQMKEPVNAESI